MGNYISRRSSFHPSPGKIILPNGTVREFDQPVSVAELMLEHPQQVVMEFKSLLHGAKPTPLPADHKLDFKKAYVMIPMMKRGKALSADESRLILSRTRSALLRSRSSSSSSSSSLASKLPSFSAGIMCGVARIAGEGVEDHGLDLVGKRSDQMVDVSSGPPELPPENFGEMPEYLLSRQLSSGWKPSLHTIVEKGLEKKKVSHWLF